jgi:hypothetical protein
MTPSAAPFRTSQHHKIPPQDPTTAEYVREPLAPGITHINILLKNLHNSTMDPSFITFEDAVVSWYSDLILHCRTATDTTGTEDTIFRAFGVTSPACPT